MESASAQARICNRKGLHARAAAKLVKTASEFDARITVTHRNKTAGATSILSLLMLAAEMGVELDLAAEGPQAQRAVDALVALIGRRFDETE
jgi:phosphocarrier protein HPr